MERRMGWGFSAELGAEMAAKARRDRAYRAYEAGEMSRFEAAMAAGMLVEDFEEHVAGERGLL